MEDQRRHASEVNKEAAEHMRQRILSFFRANPFATQKECAAHFGLNRATVNRHVNILRERMAEDMKV